MNFRSRRGSDAHSYNQVRSKKVDSFTSHPPLLEPHPLLLFLSRCRSDLKNISLNFTLPVCLGSVCCNRMWPIRSHFVHKVYPSPDSFAYRPLLAFNGTVPSNLPVTFTTPRVENFLNLVIFSGVSRSEREEYKRDDSLRVVNTTLEIALVCRPTKCLHTLHVLACFVNSLLPVNDICSRTTFQRGFLSMLKEPIRMKLWLMTNWRKLSRLDKTISATLLPFLWRNRRELWQNEGSACLANCKWTSSIDDNFWSLWFLNQSSTIWFLLQFSFYSELKECPTMKFLQSYSLSSPINRLILFRFDKMTQFRNSHVLLRLTSVNVGLFGFCLLVFHC